jgi:flagellar hook protein FlgE
MLQGLYNGLSGLLGFSKQLDNIGNNISNMNTPGFRGKTAFFENVADGEGSTLSEGFTNLSQGDTQQTGTDTDVAIDGKGLFVLHDTHGNAYYTREGHFQFDADGYLVDDTSGYRVAALNSSGGLTDFTIGDLKTLPPEATTSVAFSGNLAKTDTSKAVTGIQVFDSSGGVHTMTATLTNNTAVTAGSWTVSVSDDAGTVVGTGEVRFATDGSIQAGFNSLNLALNYNGKAQAVSLDFGTPGAFNGATQLAGVATSLGAQVKDGHGVIGVSQIEFDNSGTLQLTYSDNETKEGPQLALAYVADEQVLETQKGALYSAPAQTNISYGKPANAQFGSITGGSLELSNVDLTRELTQMIIVQRGYQASSRVLTISDSMLQQLYSSTGGGGG